MYFLTLICSLLCLCQCSCCVVVSCCSHWWHKTSTWGIFCVCVTLPLSLCRYVSRVNQEVLAFEIKIISSRMKFTDCYVGKRSNVTSSFSFYWRRGLGRGENVVVTGTTLNTGRIMHTMTSFKSIISGILAYSVMTLKRYKLVLIFRVYCRK